MMDIPTSVIKKLKSSRHVVALTGAGISSESGIPTFREAQSGLWAKYDPQELATPQAFQRNPQLVWQWYAWRRKLVNQAKPNAGHHALADLANLVNKFTLVTQNVDDLHQRAGSQNVVCLHGSIMETICSRQGHLVESWAEGTDLPLPPECPICGSLLRPNVVWFGENLPSAPLAAAKTAAQTCDIFLSIGTSALVHPAASLPFISLEHRAMLVEINPESTPLTRWASVVLNSSAGLVLPELVSQLRG